MSATIDRHVIIQDLFDKKLDVMSGYKIVHAEREQSTYIKMDYYCEADLKHPYDGPVQGGIRPFKHLKKFNYFEIKTKGDSLDEDLFWYYSARALMKMRTGKAQERKGQMTLTILVAHNPIKLLKQPEYHFVAIEPWKYYSGWIPVLDIYILVLPGMRNVDGGEPMAYLQALESNPKHQELVWKKLLGMDLDDNNVIKEVILKLDKGAYMTIAEELRLEGEIRGEKKTMLEMLDLFAPDLLTDYAQELENAESIESFATVKRKIVDEIAKRRS